MTSTKLFTMEFQSKIRSAVTVLDALNNTATQKIIGILKEEPRMVADRISAISGLELSTVQHHLQSLSTTQVVMIQEEQDQAVFSVNRDRLAKISNILKGFSQI